MALNRNYGPNGVTIRPIYTHFTCATDTEKIKYVMDAVNGSSPNPRTPLLLVLFG